MGVCIAGGPGKLPRPCERYGFSRFSIDGGELFIELVETLVVARVMGGHLRLEIGLLLFKLSELTFDGIHALGCLVEGLAGELRGGVLTVIGSL